MPHPSTVLSLRALNRATLARQHLLVRTPMPALAMVEHLVGQQAQEPGDPYVGLWTRLTGFRPAELSAAVVDRRAVRVGIMRGTIHLTTAADALVLWPLMEPVSRRQFGSTAFARRDLAGLDLADIVAAARPILEAQPLPNAKLGRLLAERWPDRPPASLALAVRALLPVVQVPPRGTWRASHQATWTTLEAWLGRPLDPTPREEALRSIVLRYLAAFGPATVMDIQAWCWLTKLKPIVESLRERLVTFRDEQGRELFDLPDAPRPDPDTAAPVRFLPEYDNLLLSHADRSRFADHDLRYTEGLFLNGSFLVDGLLRGTWRSRGVAKDGRLVVRPFTALVDADRDAVEAEAADLGRFLTDGAGVEVVIEAPASDG